MPTTACPTPEGALTHGSVPHFTKAQSPWRQVLESIVLAAGASPAGLAGLFTPELGAHVDAFLVDAAAWPQSPSWLRDLLAQLRPMRRAWAMALAADEPQRAGIETLAANAHQRATTALAEVERRRIDTADATRDPTATSTPAAAPAPSAPPAPTSRGQRIAAAFAKKRAQMLMGLTPATDVAKRAPKPARNQQTQSPPAHDEAEAPADGYTHSS